MPFRVKKKERIQLDQVDALTGNINPGQLPKFLQGFQEYPKGGKSQIGGLDLDQIIDTPYNEKSQIESIDSGTSRLHWYRKLTDRLKKEETEGPTVNIVKQQTEQTIVATEQASENGEGLTIGKDESLGIYKDDDKDSNEEGIDRALADNDDGSDEDAGAYQVKRPKTGPRRHLNPDGRVFQVIGKDEFDDDKEASTDNLLISIVNNEGEYEVKRPEQKAIEREEEAQLQ